MRWAETTSASKGTSNSPSAVAAAFITGQSESEPITIPTTGVELLLPWVISLTLVAEVSAEPGGGMTSPLQAVLEVLAVGVHVPDLAAGAELLAVQVHPQSRIAGQGVGVAVVEVAHLAHRSAQDVDHDRPG